MIYEERYTNTTSRGTRDYLSLFRDKMAPKIRTAGGEPLLLLTGLIGDRGNAVLQISRFPNLESWQSTQKDLASGRESLVESEEVRLLISVASRPKSVIPKEDKRPCYSYRKLFINPTDLRQFVDDSEKGVWPLYEQADCRIFGLFTTLWATNPLELILMAGYNGPGHWMETRFLGERPTDIDPKLYDQGKQRLSSRGQLGVRGSWVRLWRPHDF
ncbi:MAG: hypothetical protein Q8O43_08185 [Dehalococcoidia bacterium]|nr:hypothetical protein [Dehalococcoidia bacterium]